LKARRSSRWRGAPWLDYVWATGIVAVCVATDWLTQAAMSESDLVMVFLMGVLVVARLFELGPALWAAVLAVAAFDVLFVEPRLTFAVDHTRYLVTFAVMGAAGVVLAGTTARIRRQAQREHDRAQRVSALFELSRRLVGTQDEKEVCLVAAEHLESAFGNPVRLVLDTEHGDTLEVPLVGTAGRFGRLVVDGMSPSDIEPAQLELLQAHALLLTVAFERAAASAAQRRAEMQVEQERMRSSLLSSVSHDLRTPLGVILGATTTLLEPAAVSAIAERAALLRTIHDESIRLTRLLDNLLQMTRIEGGALVVEKEWHVPEEVVGSALRRAAAGADDREIAIHIQPEPALVEMDGLLVEVVLINLLENAMRHTPPGTKIEIDARQDTVEYVFEVRDHGIGIAADQLDRMFDKFQRGQDARGAGLGLAICRAIARAHGGDVVAVAHSHQAGLSMQLRLPFVAPPAEHGSAML
jgi:two-component system, OmpR family, sensor histidine kinase KdpD